jgi:hypothetical protein
LRLYRFPTFDIRKGFNYQGMEESYKLEYNNLTISIEYADKFRKVNIKSTQMEYWLLCSSLQDNGESQSIIVPSCQTLL